MKTKLLFIFLLTSLFGFAQNPIFTSSMTITADGTGGFTGGESIEKLTDGNHASKHLDRISLGADSMDFIVDLGTGITATAQSIVITSGNDAPERDPQNYEVHGSTDGISYTSIATGTMTCDAGRGQIRIFNFTTTNTTAYQFYKINLTNACNAAGDLHQVAEVQLYDAYVFPKENPIFTPSMTITADGTGGFTGGESIEKLTDGNHASKHLDRISLGADSMDFIVDLGTGITATAQSIVITSGNDAPERDPQNYEVHGSTDGISYTSIATGTMTCDAGRGQVRTYDFSTTNTTAYQFYKINLTNACNAAGDLHQVAEVQLHEAPSLGVNDHLFNEVAMYPNPTKGDVYFKNLGKLKDVSIKVFNITGQLVKEERDVKSNNYKLNFESGSGMYFIEVSAENARKTYKLIKS